MALPPGPGGEGESAPSPGLIHTCAECGAGRRQADRQTGTYSFLRAGAATSTVLNRLVLACPRWKGEFSMTPPEGMVYSRGPERGRAARLTQYTGGNTTGRGRHSTFFLLSPPAPLGNRAPPRPPAQPATSSPSKGAQEASERGVGDSGVGKAHEVIQQPRPPPEFRSLSGPWTHQPGSSPGRGLSAPQPCPPPRLQDGDGPDYQPLRPPSLLSSQPRQGEERKRLLEWAQGPGLWRRVREQDSDSFYYLLGIPPEQSKLLGL